MQTPALNEHHQRLARFAGTWQGTEKMHPSQWLPKGGECTATNTWRVDLAGYVVIVDYQQLSDGKVTYAGHGVYTIEPGTNDVVLHWFDVIGGQAEQFRGNWNDDVLTIQSKNPMGHMRLTYDLSTAGKMTTRGEMSTDGETWSTLFDGHHERQPD